MKKPKKPRKVWMYCPPKPKLPETLKRTIFTKANEFVETYFKPSLIGPPPKDPHENYIIDIGIKQHGRFLYFYSVYQAREPNSINPTYEILHSRLEYAGAENFNIAYMRHTGEWNTIYFDVPMDECFSLIREDPLLTLIH
jgi:hypothetical protein